MNQEEALRVAVALLRESRRGNEPELAVDASRVRIKHGLLIAPYNSVRYLASRNVQDRLLDCWPILVDLTTGQARFGRLHERHLWRDDGA
ncbi:hypothetical protein ACEZCY_01255 [Streptacidiphilus sp. N1-12]|uniref:Immunity protein 35 domain-containing protein n=2 Tax=Streptacidiphilus alkalitolerans TaxID=3342712 RepID=A0ABV6WWV7_9ACTN